MKFDIITIFPKIFDSYFNESILGRAQKEKKIEIKIHNLRDYATDKHQTVDDTPYGGGAGMVLKVEPIFNAVNRILSIENNSDIKNVDKQSLQFTVDSSQTEENRNKSQLTFYGLQAGEGEDSLQSEEKEGIKNRKGDDKNRIILFSAKGKKYTQADAKRLSQYENLIMICGRYEGVDERVAEHIIDEEFSIGEYVLTGGEIPAMIVVDSVSRLLPGVLGNKESLSEESYSISSRSTVDGSQIEKDKDGSRFTVHNSQNSSQFAANGLQEGENDIKNDLPVTSYQSQVTREYPHYTKPEEFNGWKVPDVLLSGNHKEIEKWRREKMN